MVNRPRVLILAGGRGTRLAAVVPDDPKPLASVSGHPFLFWLIKYLYKESFEKITILTGFGSEKIESFVLNDPMGKTDITIIKEDYPLGTGGAIKNAIHLFPDEKDFLVVNGDTLFTIDYDYFLKRSWGHRLSVALGFLAMLWLSRLPGEPRVLG